MFIIGLLAGVSIAKIGMSDGEEELTYDEARSKVITTDDSLLPKVSTESISPSRAFSLPKAVPMNTRMNFSVLDQPATTTVQIAHVVVTMPTWVAVYEEVNDTPGSILGAQKVVSGDKDTVVSLIRPAGLTAGKIYFAVLLEDNGDGVFNRGSDIPPVSLENVVMVKFKAL